MLKKVALAVAGVFACAASAQAAWEVHGYGRLGGQWDGELNNHMYTKGKPDYRTVTSNDENNNQVEVTVSKKEKVKGGVTSNFVVRAEYGNLNAGDNSAFYSSQGSEHSGASSGQFEVKEAFVELGGFGFLGSDTKIWAGQRFLNRSQALLSKEFWKQSSGVGFGAEIGKFGAAIVSTDPGNTTGSNVKEKNTGNTLTTLDFWYSGLEVPGGNLQFDLKLMKQANKEETAGGPQPSGRYTSNAENGIGGAITYNTTWYGLKGWTQNIVAYGQGIASNRGVNFGSWSDGFGKDTSTWFFSSYGVADLGPSVQLASEVTSWQPKHVNWNGDLNVTRTVVALQPSIKLNEFSRVILTGSYGRETMKNQNPGAATPAPTWFGGGNKTKAEYYALEAAVAFTVNSDYFGRPQIKPFVSWVKASDKAFAGNININNGDDNQATWGVEAEIWW